MHNFWFQQKLDQELDKQRAEMDQEREEGYREAWEMLKEEHKKNLKLEAYIADLESVLGEPWNETPYEPMSASEWMDQR